MIQSTFQYERVFEVLRELYGEPNWRPHQEPVAELVSTILSQNTNDGNRDAAFERLQYRFGRGNWMAVRDARPEEVVEAIRPAGLAPQKGPRIQQVLRTLTHADGEISMDFLRDMPLEEARAWLMRLPGVGPKTAAIVLLFALGRPAFPVDTHVYRVTRRLGLIPRTLSVEKAHCELERLVPPAHYYAFHLNLVRHGRQVCLARRPRCSQCLLAAYCKFYQSGGW